MIEKRSCWIIILMMGFLVIPVSAIPDPSAVYCGQLGYEYIIDRTDDGEVGLCQFPDGSTARAWAFLRGEAGQEHNYCKEKGYEYQVVENDSRCPGMYFGKCVLCISPNGKEIEVTELMKQDGKYPDFSKWTLSRCNNNLVCDPEKGENYKNCLQDCPSGSPDDYCDKIEDGICDPDCLPEEDPDCELHTATNISKPPETKEENLLKNYFFYILALFIGISAILLIYRKKKNITEKEMKEYEIMKWVKKKLEEGENPDILKENLKEKGHDTKIVDKVKRLLQD